MAQRVTVLLIDDLDEESEASETVTFGLDGSTYEIDLTDEHAAQLRDAFAPYVAAARRLGARQAPQRQRRAARGGTPGATKKATGNVAQNGQVQDVREWARANGHQVSDRGRLSAAVQAAYEAAHS